jgi:hypothetical protein
MSAVLERLREQLDALQQEIEAVAVVAAEVDTVKADCAVAMEAAYGDAIRLSEASRERAASRCSSVFAARPACRSPALLASAAANRHFRPRNE